MKRLVSTGKCTQIIWREKIMINNTIIYYNPALLIEEMDSKKIV